jgi:biotin carboxyl carrier protein
MHAPSIHGELNRLWHDFKNWIASFEEKNIHQEKILFKKKLSQHWNSLRKKGVPDYFLNTIWYHRRRKLIFIILCIALFPVRLTILAPAELVPAHPSVIRVPIEGVVDEFFVAPNQKVVEGQPLFKLDLTSLHSRLQIAQQETQIASTEYRQSTLQSLNDPKSRSQLVPQEGKASERKLEADYAKELLEKAQIKSPKAGIVLFDDPTEWIGKPVVAGERVMLVTDENDTEIEAWVALSNAIELPNEAKVTLYLNTSPLSPIDGTLRYLGYEAIQRPDNNYAYRLRAKINPHEPLGRIGLKGTAKISGHFVPTVYWVFRKPLAVLRQFLGI